MPVRMKSRNTPTQRTIAHLRAAGWLVDIAERRQGPVTFDLFGCIDLVAVHPDDKRVLFIQVTSADHVADRLAKTRAQPTTALLLKAGVDIEVWGWGDSATPRIERLA